MKKMEIREFAIKAVKEEGMPECIDLSTLSGIFIREEGEDREVFGIAKEGDDNERP